MDTQRKRSDLESLLEVWRRRKLLAFLVFASVFTAAASYATFLPATYLSTATVLVERQQVPEEFVRSTVTGAFETRLQTISQELLSSSHLENLIARFDLYPEMRRRVPTEKTTERMRRDIQLETKGVLQRGRGGTIITFTISYKGRDPQKVALVTNTLASSYVEANLQSRERAAAGTAQFLRAQLESVKQQLNEQERRVREFKERYSGELPEQQRANLTTVERFTAAVLANGEKQNRSNERRMLIASQLAEAEAAGPAGGPDATAARIAKLNGELAELQTRFTDKYPDVVRLKSEIASLELQLTQAKTNREQRKEASPVVNPNALRLKQEITRLELEIKTLKAEEENLRQSITLYQRRIENTPRREQEFQELGRDYETKKELYKTLLKRHEEADLAETLEKRQKGEQFRVLEPAIPSNDPTPPKPHHLALMGLVLSLGLAAGTVLAAERLDTSFHSAEDLQASTPVPVLVSIPTIVSEGDARRRRRRVFLGSIILVLGLALIVAASYLIARGDAFLAKQIFQAWHARR